jgi:iron complex outermembrane receptor protein
MKSCLRCKKKPLVSALAIAFVSAGYCIPGNAQSLTTANGGKGIETITVTAQGRRETIQEIPYNISAVGGEALAELHIVDQTELLRNISGATVVDRGYRNAGVLSGVTIRGLNVNGSALGDYQTSAVPTVSTYVNNTPIFANFLIKDIDRVEVLRGPQGTLYGSGSLGGTVRYITNQPELKQFSGRVDLDLGQTSGSGGTNKSIDVLANVPFGATAALRIVAGRVDNDGVIDYRNVYVLDAQGAPVAPKGVLDPAASYRNVKDADSVKIDYARLSLLVKPSDKMSALLTYQTQTDDIGGRRQPTRGLDGFGVPYGKYENGSVQLEPSKRDVSMTSLDLDFDLGFATLTSDTSFYDQNGHSLSENTGYYAQVGWLSGYYGNYPRPMAQASRSYGDKAIVQELRLASKKGGAWDYIVGAFYMKQNLKATQYSYLKGFLNWSNASGWGADSENDFVFDRKQEFKETALYGELTYHITQKLRVTGGARHFSGDFDNDSVLGSGVFSPSNATVHPIFSKSDSGTLFKGNFSYELTPKQSLYGTVSEGYRRGGANAVPLTGIFAESAAYQSYDPDRNTNYELGIKGASGAHRYNLSAFRVDWKDIQVDVATPNWGFYAAQNGGKAHTQGIEFEAEGRISDAWRYSINYAYVDAKLDSDVVRPYGSPPKLVAAAGTQLPGTPKNVLSGSLSHTSILSNGRYWTNRINGYYQDASENSILPSAFYKKTWESFSIWGISSTIVDEKWSASLYVKNLFNSDGITGGFLETHMGTLPADGYFGNGSKVFISQPRTVGVSLSYNF